MTLEQIRFKFTLLLISPLHVGTGGFEPFSKLRPEAIVSDENAESDVAVILRDEQGRPCLPVSTLKGCLRSLYNDPEDEDVRLLFGAIRQQDQDDPGIPTGQMGKLFFRLGRLVELETPKEGEWPHYRADQYSYIQTRTAINRQTGTALEHNLFNQELVIPGLSFEVAGCLEDAAVEACEAFGRLLGKMATSEGFSIGKGQSLGQGRMKLILPNGEGLSAVKRSLTEAGLSEGAFLLPVKKAGQDTKGLSVTLSLYCKGPYLTVDPSRAGQKGNVSDAAIKGQVDTDGKPVLLPGSLMGAMRSRLAWMQQKAGKQLKPDDPSTILKEGVRAETLKPSERLFGVTGWQSLVQVVSIDCLEAGKPESLTSVALDSFSGAPLTGALFTTQAHAGCRYTVKLALAARQGRGHGHVDDEEAFKVLIQDFKENGLMLGHGTSKGFGWFDVAKVEEAHG